jgi:hypothetical protein
VCRTPKHEKVDNFCGTIVETTSIAGMLSRHVAASLLTMICAATVLGIDDLESSENVSSASLGLIAWRAARQLKQRNYAAGGPGIDTSSRRSEREDSWHACIIKMMEPVMGEVYDVYNMTAAIAVGQGCHQKIAPRIAVYLDGIFEGFAENTLAPSTDSEISGDSESVWQLRLASHLDYTKIVAGGHVMNCIVSFAPDPLPSDWQEVLAVLPSNFHTIAEPVFFWSTKTRIELARQQRRRFSESLTYTSNWDRFLDFSAGRLFYTSDQHRADAIPPHVLQAMGVKHEWVGLLGRTGDLLHFSFALGTYHCDESHTSLQFEISVYLDFSLSHTASLSSEYVVINGECTTGFAEVSVILNIPEEMSALMYMHHVVLEVVNKRTGGSIVQSTACILSESVEKEWKIGITIPQVQDLLASLALPGGGGGGGGEGR